MKQRLYKTYLRTTRFNKRVSDSITPAGKIVFATFFVALFFGNRPEKTFIYYLMVLALSFLIVSLLFSLRFKTAIKVTTHLPKRASVGENVSYRIEIENSGSVVEDGLFYREIVSQTPLSLDEFLTGREENEDRRNRFDQLFGYYRWLFLSKMKAGIVPQFQELPRLLPREKRALSASFTPLRRGVIHFEGFALFRTDPFGLFRRKIIVKMAHNITVFPQLYPLSITQFVGRGVLNRGGGDESNQKGCSGDFLSLREYVPGDPVKQIDWKSTAKKEAIIIREFQKEAQARTTIFLDVTSSLSFDLLVEEAISYVGSFITSAPLQMNIGDIVTSNHLYTASVGSREAKNEELLQALAVAKTEHHSDYATLFNYISEKHRLIGHFMAIFTSLSSLNLSVLKELRLYGVSYSAILLGDIISSETEELARKEGVRIIKKRSWHTGGNV